MEPNVEVLDLVLSLQLVY